MAKQDELYAEAVATYGAALERLARAYDTDADRVRDLLQDIHVALWQSLSRFEGRCSMRLAHPEQGWRAFAIFAGILVLFAWIGEANRDAANRLQARIDALERDE